MKKFIFLLSAFFLLLTPQVTSAHLIGQAPFFVVDGQYSGFYPVPTSSLPDFSLPQDLAPGIHLISQPVSFELDASKLPAPPDVVAKTKFTWDFGDGSSGTGLKQTHTYQKIGSYIINVYADDGTTPQPQLIESAMINILPSKDYQLPKAVIKVNGKQSSDPLVDIMHIQFGTPIQFDGSASEDTSSKIVSYFWDFGDQQTSSSPNFSHTYAQGLSQVFPLLRIKDENGFIADSFVEIQNQDSKINYLTNLNQNPTIPNQTGSSSSPSQLKYTLIGIALLLGLILGIRSLFSKKTNKD